MERVAKRISHELKVRLLKVVATTELTPYMMRITLSGDELVGFTSAAPEDHVKVFFPANGQDKPILPKLTPQGPVFSEGIIMRDYTPSRYNTQTNELDLDFVLHKNGPASQWAATAKVGQYLGIAGPRGSFIYPDFDWYLLVGDDTAIPSFGRRLREMPEGKKALVVIETEDESTHQNFETKADMEIIWVHRNGKPSDGPFLIENAIRQLKFPEGECLTIISCEKSAASQLRQVMESDFGFNKEWVKATGYWK